MGGQAETKRLDASRSLGQGGLRDKYHLVLLPQHNRNPMTILKTSVHFPESTRGKEKSQRSGLIHSEVKMAD